MGMGVYEELGVKPMINAWGTITKVGGSRMHPDVLEAMTEASRSFVDIHVLLDRAGQAIARMIGVEAAAITSGASAGLAIAAAACLARTDPARILQLPDTTSMPDEALVLKAHRVLYDQALRLTGVRMVEVGVASFASLEQVEAAISERTAMFFYSAESASSRGSLPLAEIAAILKPHHIPLIVDAAAELPPKSNLTAFLDAGADLVVFSGGKEIRGPQSSGLILGDQEKIGWCRANSYPEHNVGRSMKVDKETIVGLVKAVELFTQRDYDQIYRDWGRMVDSLVEALGEVTGLEVRRGLPTQPGIQPADIPRAYCRPHHTTAAVLQQRLREGQPAVLAGVEGDELALNPQTLDVEEIPAVAAAVIAALDQR
jgi:L-seryl-tRNA(Ser) seleniumtransferase